jgi:drug/metabolite transporter (DMT)-like permease
MKRLRGGLPCRPSRNEPSQTSNLRGILFMLAAVATFSMMDVCLAAVAAPSGNAGCRLARADFFALVLTWIALSGGFRQVVSRRWRRICCAACSPPPCWRRLRMRCVNCRLAEAYSLFFVAPLLVTHLPCPCLGNRGEALGSDRDWPGGRLVARPDTGRMFNLGSLAVLFAALAYAISAITVRVLGRTESTQSMVFWMIVLLSMFATAAAWHDWVALRVADWPILLGLAISGALGQYAITEAFKNSDASVVVPFDYTALIWGIAFDALIWHTTPDRMMLAGAAIIVGSGITDPPRTHTALNACSRKAAQRCRAHGNQFLPKASSSCSMRSIWLSGSPRARRASARWAK